MLKTLLTFALALTFFVGCSSDSGDSGTTVKKAPTYKTGTFIVTKPVENLHYKTNSFDDYTDENGKFKYKEDENITFSVAGVDLGTAKAIPVMTPFNIVPVSGDVENSAAANMVVLLMSIDADGAGSVLTIDNAVNAYSYASNFDLSNITDITSLLNGLTSAGDKEYTQVKTESAVASALSAITDYFKNEKESVPAEDTNSSTSWYDDVVNYIKSAPQR